MTVSKQELSIEDLIQPNKRNQVTNAQMIPAIVKAIEADSREQLVLLQEHYPAVFEASSTKYLNKTHKADLSRILYDEESTQDVV